MNLMILYELRMMLISFKCTSGLSKTCDEYDSCYRINTSNSLCIEHTWSHRSFHTVQWERWGIFQWESHRFWWLMKIHWWLPLLVCDHHWRMQWLTLLLIQTPAPDSEMWESCKLGLATWTRPPLLQHPHPVTREISGIYFNKSIIIRNWQLQMLFMLMTTETINLVNTSNHVCYCRSSKQDTDTICL